MKRLIRIMVLVVLISSISVSGVEASSNLSRIYGKTRIETAIELSKKAYKKSNTVVLAGYNGEVDSLSGSMLAHHKQGPMLITLKDRLPESVAKRIRELGAKEIYLLGGEGVISEKVEKDLLDLEYDVIRVGGKDRESTAIDIAKEVKGENIGEVFLSLGRGTYADALAIGPISARNKKPIFLTKTDKIPEATKDALKNLGVKKVTIVGGEKAIGKSVEDELASMTISFNRVSGRNRAGTALKIAKEYLPNPNGFILANGYNYADALIGGYFSAKESSPILLVGDKSIGEETLDYIGEKKLNTYILGGEGAVGQGVFTDVNLALKDPIVLNRLFIEGTGENFTSHKIKAETNIRDGLVYKFYLKHENDQEWTLLQDYKKDSSLDWTPEREGNYQYRVEVKYENARKAQVEKIETIKIEAVKPAKISSLDLQGDRYEKKKHTIVAQASGKNEVLYKFYIRDYSTGRWRVIQDYSKKNTVDWTPDKYGDYRYAVRVKDIHSTRDYDDILGYDETINPPINYSVNNYDISLENMLASQSGRKSVNGGWATASKAEIREYLDPTNFLQFDARGNNGQIKPLVSIEVKLNGLNVRKDPNTGSKILAKVSSGDVYIVLDEKDGWYKVNAQGKIGWISGLHTDYVNDVPVEMYQFMVLSSPAGVPVDQINLELKGMGILEGKGAAFVEGSKKHKLNEFYLIAHALLESGRGRSTLAQGIRVDRVDGKPVDPRVVYNMYGIGAKDRDANRLGAETAYKEGWFTPELAISEGAKWISDGYINNPTYKQDTLYKMRYNPAMPGHWHKYATDIAWAYKQTKFIGEMTDRARNVKGIVLNFDIPKYK